MILLAVIFEVFLPFFCRLSHIDIARCLVQLNISGVSHLNLICITHTPKLNILVLDTYILVYEL